MTVQWLLEILAGCEIIELQISGRCALIVVKDKEKL